MSYSPSHINNIIKNQNINWDRFYPDKNLSKFPILSNFFSIITSPLRLIAELAARLTGIHTNQRDVVVKYPESNEDKVRFILSNDKFFSDREKENLILHMQQETKRNNREAAKKITRDPYYAYKTINPETKKPMFIYPYKSKDYEKDSKGNLQFSKDEYKARVNWVTSLLPKYDKDNLEGKDLTNLRDSLINSVNNKLIDNINYVIPVNKEKGYIEISGFNNGKPNIYLYNAAKDLIGVCKNNESPEKISEMIKKVDLLPPYSERTSLDLQDYMQLSKEKQKELPETYRNFMDKLSEVYASKDYSYAKKVSTICNIMQHESKNYDSINKAPFLRSQTINFKNNECFFEIKMADDQKPIYNLYDQHANLLLSSQDRISPEMLETFHDHKIEKQKNPKTTAKETLEHSKVSLTQLIDSNTDKSHSSKSENDLSKEKIDVNDIKSLKDILKGADNNDLSDNKTNTAPILDQDIEK